MAQDVIIQPLNLDDFTITEDTQHPGFADLAQSEVGDAAGPLDGYDDIVEELLGFVNALDSGLQLLAGATGGDLDDTFADVLTLQPELVANTLTDVVGAMPAVDAGVSDLGQQLESVSTPAPPTDGGGDGGGGDGGGGGGGGGGPTEVKYYSQAPATKHGTHKTFVAAQMSTGDPNNKITVASYAVTSDAGNAFAIDHVTNLNDGHRSDLFFGFFVKFSPPAVGQYTGLLEVHTSIGVNAVSKIWKVILSGNGI